MEDLVVEDLGIFLPKISQKRCVDLLKEDIWIFSQQISRYFLRINSNRRYLAPSEEDLQVLIFLDDLQISQTISRFCQRSFLDLSIKDDQVLSQIFNLLRNLQIFFPEDLQSSPKNCPPRSVNVLSEDLQIFSQIIFSRKACRHFLKKSVEVRSHKKISEYSKRRYLGLAVEKSEYSLRGFGDFLLEDLVIQNVRRFFREEM